MVDKEKEIMVDKEEANLIMSFGPKFAKGLKSMQICNGAYLLKICLKKIRRNTIC